MVFKEGWVGRVFDLVSVICFVVGLLAFVIFAAYQPGALYIMLLAIAATAGVWMAIRGFIIVVDWLDK